eukprot:2600649-Pyramimonas_sp.AAC.1
MESIGFTCGNIMDGFGGLQSYAHGMSAEFIHHHAINDIEVTFQEWIVGSGDNVMIDDSDD